MVWTKDLSADQAEAYKKTFHVDIVGQYTDESEQAPFARAMRRDPEALVLDAGCGTGRHLLNTAPDQSFVAMDLSLEMVKLARRELGRGWYVVGELERMPFKDGAFDEVISSRVMQHIHDQQQAIHEMSRVCATRGDVLVLALNSWTLHCLYKTVCMSFLRRLLDWPYRLFKAKRSPFMEWPFDYDNYCSLPEMARMFRRAGLRVIRREGGTIGLPWVFYAFGWARWIQKYGYRFVRKYFELCRPIEDRLANVFPFKYRMDKVIVQGVKEAKAPATAARSCRPETMDSVPSAGQLSPIN